MGARQPHHWAKDRRDAREDERVIADLLKSSPLVSNFVDATELFDRCDFEAQLVGGRWRRAVRIEVKSKRQAYREPAKMWPEHPESDLLVVDEVSFRRMIWCGGPLILVVHDHPGRRWALFGTWDLVLAPKRRYERLGDRGSGRFLKGKLLLPFSAASVLVDAVSVEDFVRVADLCSDHLSECAAVSRTGWRLLQEDDR